MFFGTNVKFGIPSFEKIIDTFPAGYPTNISESDGE
jgi:hypothetical protein